MMTDQLSAPKPRSRPSIFAVMSLTAGIMGWFVVPLPFLGGLTAIVTGHLALWHVRRAATAGGGVNGRMLAVAGLILGYLNVVTLAYVFLMFLIVVTHQVHLPFRMPGQPVGP